MAALQCDANRSQGAVLLFSLPLRSLCAAPQRLPLQQLPLTGKEFSTAMTYSTPRSSCLADSLKDANKA